MVIRETAWGVRKNCKIAGPDCQECEGNRQRQGNVDSKNAPSVNKEDGAGSLRAGISWRAAPNSMQVGAVSGGVALIERPVRSGRPYSLVLGWHVAWSTFSQHTSARSSPCCGECAVYFSLVLS